MASQRPTHEAPPRYSRRPSPNERVLAIAPDFPLAVDAVRLVQETFPGTSSADAWDFVQRLARLVREDLQRRQQREANASHRDAPEHPPEDDPPSVIPEDSPMPDAA